MQKQPLTFQSFYPLSDEACCQRIAAVKERLADRCVILGHYYQRDEVYQFADYTGDSLQLSFQAAKTTAPHIVFCGVHFMAEVADMLTSPDQAVMLPDMAAGCSMADMANRKAVEESWQALSQILDPDEVVTPVTYVNSAADLKAFCGEHGGTICTSSNAESVLTWALSQREKVLFFPDQHLGRNTAHAMGIPLEEMAVWDFRKPQGGLTEAEIKKARILLWDGWCSVHQRFEPEQITAYREKYPEAKVIAHPESSFEVCQAADAIGSTSFILKTIDEAPPNTNWLVATEFNLVNRMAKQFAKENKVVRFMAPTVSMCSTMFRTDPQHLLWVLENIEKGNIVNRVIVPEETRRLSNIALDKMFTITEKSQ